MAGNSWHGNDRHGTLVEVPFYYSELQRGELTREEYHRRVLEHAGLPVPADSTGSSGMRSAATSSGSDRGIARLNRGIVDSL